MNNYVFSVDIYARNYSVTVNVMLLLIVDWTCYESSNLAKFVNIPIT